MCVSIKPTKEHCAELAANIRQADADESRAAGIEPSMESIWSFVRMSDRRRTFLIRGRVAAIGGVVTTGLGVGNVWLLTANICDATKLTFWRTSKKAIVEFQEGFDELFVRIDARYSRAIAWAMRLGFEVGDPEPLPNGSMFCLARRKS